MDIIDSVVGAMGTGLATAVGALIKLSNRVSVLEKAHEETAKRIDEKFEAIRDLNDAIGKNIDEKFESQGKRLDRIERSMNGHLLRE